MSGPLYQRELALPLHPSTGTASRPVNVIVFLEACGCGFRSGPKGGVCACGNAIPAVGEQPIGASKYTEVY